VWQAGRRAEAAVEQTAVPARTRRRAWALAWSSAARLGAVSAIVLIPCFWHSRIHAGDLSSHLYNAWLAGLIREGKLEGLAVVPQWTNILLDWMLRGLMSLGGPRTAERVAVAACVLVFFWGAFRLVSALARRPAWLLSTCLAVLTYGWVFHMGFFNFYLSLGLCCWALACFWKQGARSLAAWLLLLPATLAHALPVAWALAMGGYIWLARRLRPRRRLILVALALAGILGLRWSLSASFETDWRFQQLASASGADQAWVYGKAYFPVFVGMLAVWGLMPLRRINDHGRLRTFLGTPFQMALLTGAGVFLLPYFILFPGHTLALQFLDKRMSLAAAVLVCGLAAASRARWLERVLTGLVTVAFFALLWVDQGRWNRLEDQVERAVRLIGPGQRVVSGLCLKGSRVDALRHMVDRACIGWCFSYGNYEPASGQFSVRALRPNPVVVSGRNQAYQLERGVYIVRPEDVPLYQIEWADPGRAIAIRSLKPGDRAGQGACVAKLH